MLFGRIAAYVQSPITFRLSKIHSVDSVVDHDSHVGPSYFADAGLPEIKF